MRLIDADIIVNYQTYDDEYEELQNHKSTIAEFLDTMTDEGCPEAVDAVPVRHGRWETDGIMMDECEYLMTRCTACGGTYEYGYNMPFCPNCGADMRKDGDHHED